MMEAKKAAVSTCSIDVCRGNEVRLYEMCGKHYKKSIEDAKAKMMVATDDNF